jgi:hypothetical protein
MGVRLTRVITSVMARGAVVTIPETGLGKPACAPGEIT